MITKEIFSSNLKKNIIINFIFRILLFKNHKIDINFKDNEGNNNLISACYSNSNINIINI
jgi:hypothetical protein